MTKTAKISRRGFFVGAATVGAAAVGAVIAPSMRPEPAAEPVAKPAPKKGGGYSVTDHVKRYYKSTLV
ncbi:MAG: twin-arginine translocation signal domain-containing protein [Pigmentiphaga sp.]|uniref:twin-arginine translocation signal domain-containing protein n=1 Tax=Pigmentiphaga sp. TaxID=1977564 RepID=UPI0029A641F0|nr:twin-arginine translocation signal domain-containing protein [Pigmentiphaga sp.]MDX3906533.1 twin-arginine translocation signal domain-containing protein [Pigmentiphaga sp.]